MVFLFFFWKSHMVSQFCVLCVFWVVWEHFPVCVCVCVHLCFCFVRGYVNWILLFLSLAHLVARSLTHSFIFFTQSFSHFRDNPLLKTNLQRRLFSSRLMIETIMRVCVCVCEWVLGDVNAATAAVVAASRGIKRRCCNEMVLCWNISLNTTPYRQTQFSRVSSGKRLRILNTKNNTIHKTIILRHKTTKQTYI